MRFSMVFAQVPARKEADVSPTLSYSSFLSNNNPPFKLNGK